MWKEASRYYKEALDMNADHETARDRFHQIRIILSQQVCFSISVFSSTYLELWV